MARARTQASAVRTRSTSPPGPCGYAEYPRDFLGDAFAVAGLAVINVGVIVAALTGVLLAEAWTVVRSRP